MGLSCRCCKKRGRCICKACPTIESETLELYRDYQEFDEDGNVYDERIDLAGHPDNPVPIFDFLGGTFGPLFGPEPTYPPNFEIQHTCGYGKLMTVGDTEYGGIGEDDSTDITDLDQGIPPCYREMPPKLIPPVKCRRTRNCPFGYRCKNGECEPVESIPKDGYPEECYLEYEQYTCEANGPRMGRVGPSKKSTFFGIGLIPGNQDLIECTEEEGGVSCPDGYECVQSTDPPEQIRTRPPLDEPQSCDEGNPLAEECPDGYECECGNCEPEKVDLPLKSYCQLERTPCDPDNPCPEGYECVTVKVLGDPDSGESFCEPISGELTKNFLQHPIQAQFGLYPCRNPHKNEICAPQDDPIPCDIPDCVEPVGKLPDSCEECTDGACQEHFGDDYKCNRNGDCEKENSNPCPEGYECRSDPSNPIVETFPSVMQRSSEEPSECTDDACVEEFGPGFKCNSNGDCEIDPEDGTDTNCQAIFGQGFEYYPTQPIRDINGNKVICDGFDSEVPACGDSTGDPNSVCEEGECHEIVPSCQRIPTNCLPVESVNEPDWIFVENSGLPVFLVPTDGLPYGPLPLPERGEFISEFSCTGDDNGNGNGTCCDDCAAEYGPGVECVHKPDEDRPGYYCEGRNVFTGGTRKRRYNELWRDNHIGACNEVDVNNGECTSECCYETFGDPWLPNHTWTCRQRTRVIEPLEEPIDCEDDAGCPDGYRCEEGNCVPANLLPELEPSRPCDDGACPAGYRCVEGFCRPTSIANPDAGLSCYLEPIDPYANPEDDLDSLIRDFPEFRELKCPDIDQYCGPNAEVEVNYLNPGLNDLPDADDFPSTCKALADFVTTLSQADPSWTSDQSYCEKVYGLGFECEEAQPTGIAGDTDAECELKTGLPGSKCVTLADGTKECFTPISCVKDNKKCPNGYDCINEQCQVDCEAKYGPGAECVDLVEPGDKEDRWCQPPCSDDICEEEYGVGFRCNDDGDCELVRDRDLDSRIPRPIGENPTYDPDDDDDELYFGHTTLWGGSNDNNFGVGVFNLDTTKIRTRLYLDYGYHLHYPFDKGHMGTELVPSGCAVQPTLKTNVWKYKGNKGRNRVPYPKVNTIAIGNRYPSTHSFIDDEEDFDDFTKIGSGPYFGKYCDRAVATDEPGGLNGLGNPPLTNWNREANPSEDENGNTIYAPQHENDDYSAKKDPRGIVKGCNPAFVIPCDMNPKNTRPFEYLNHSHEDSGVRTGVCKKDMDDWRASNQSVFSHNQVPSGPVGGLIIDTVEFVPIDYNFPAHTTSPDMWLWSGTTEYGPSVFNNLGGPFAITKNNRVLVPATTLPVYMAVYYNSTIGRQPIRYDDPNMDINQFLPPANGWLENIWQLGDIANPLDINNVIEHGQLTYSRHAFQPELAELGLVLPALNFRKGYKYESMYNSDYIEEYDHLPVDRHWGMPSEETCTDPKQNIEISCADDSVFSRWSMLVDSSDNPIECNDESDLSDDNEQCVCKGHMPVTEDSGNWEPGKQGRFPLGCEPSPPVLDFYKGIVYKRPDPPLCTDESCEDLFGDGFTCDGDGNCVGTLCPKGFICGPPDDENMIVRPLPPHSLCEEGICDQFGKDYRCIEGKPIENDDNAFCGEGTTTQDEADQYCVGLYGEGYTCQGISEFGDGICTGPNTCEKPNRMCTAIDACDSDPAQGFYLQSCGDDLETNPPIDERCDADGNCPTGYECENGNCVPTIEGSDDVKVTKHLFDFWNTGTPFPSNNGDVTDSHLTWFRSSLDQYGEIQLKPWINATERNIEEKYPERNLHGVAPPEEQDPAQSCEFDPCPPGFKCDPGSNLCVPGEGSRNSQVTYPPLLYSGLKSGGYKTRDGIKNQLGLEDKDAGKSKETVDRAIKQWWVEEPYTVQNPIEEFAILGSMYHTYLAQIGVSPSLKSYDLDWLQQGFIQKQLMEQSLRETEAAKGFWENGGGSGGPQSQDIDEEFLNRIEGDDGQLTPGDLFNILQSGGNADEPRLPWRGNFTDVREVYRTVGTEVLNEDDQGIFAQTKANSLSWMPDRSAVGLPVGSYHGRDGMIRYNIHPWSQIYEQMRITDSLLEMGRDFQEVQNILSSIELQCKNGIFNYGTPTIVEPFGYDEIGNVNFELNQPHGSHLAELTTPRILNYRPTATCPPGNALRIKIGGPGQALSIYEYQYPLTTGGLANFNIVMPGGALWGPTSLGYGDRIGVLPFVSQGLGVIATYPAYARGASATPAEEVFTDRAVLTQFGLVEFFMPSGATIEPYLLHNGAFIQGKVYGASMWPYDHSLTYITSPNSGINGEHYPDDFYVNGHGYFDPDDLQANGLQNLDPDMGLFTYCFIAGMNGYDSLPGLPRAWSFGMVGGSLHGAFNHHVGNGNANSPSWPDFGEGTREQLDQGRAALLEKKANWGSFADHYFDKYDYPNNFDLTFFDPVDVGGNVPGTYSYSGNIDSGTITNPDGTSTFVNSRACHGTLMSRELVRRFMAEDMTDPNFLQDFYYAQVVFERGDGPLRVHTPVVNVFDVSTLEGTHDVQLVLKREGESGILIEGPGAGTWQGLPRPATHYKTSKYQRLDGEDCVDTYDKECAVGGSSSCGDDTGEGLVLYTLAPHEECADCGVHKDAGDFLYGIETDDWVCVEGKVLDDENDPDRYCGGSASKGFADLYCQDMYGPGYTCSGIELVEGTVCLTDQECEDQIGIPGSYCHNGECVKPGQCKGPMTCELQGLLPAITDSSQTGVMDKIFGIPPNLAVGLDNILPSVNLNNYLLLDDDDPNLVLGILDLTLYYIANEYGSDGSIAPNGQVITDEFLRDLAPWYFYGEPDFTIDNPSRVSLRGAVLDSVPMPDWLSISLYGGPGFRRVFFSVGHPDVRPDFAPQEYICAKMTNPATGLHNSRPDFDDGDMSITYASGDMNQCIKTSRFYSGERADYTPLHGTRTYQMHPGLEVPPPVVTTWQRQEHADVLGVTPFHWPWAIGDLCVDWAAGSPRRGGNMGTGVDGRHGFNHENALENVKRYYFKTIEEYAPEDFLDSKGRLIAERTVTHNEFPNSYEAELYKLAIISGTTNAGDMEFVSDIHRQKNDILQAKPPCRLWTNIYDFKWPLTPATGINTPPVNQCDQRIVAEDTAETEETENEPTENEPTVNTVHGNLAINISEKPIIRFKAGGIENKTRNGIRISETAPDKLWFAIDGDGCEDIEEHDPPVPCDPEDDDACGEDYVCRQIEGCEDDNTYCMPKECTPTPRRQALTDYREELGFQHLVLQPTTNPRLNDFVRCPLHYVEIPHWGPKVQLKSALFNRDLITVEECSECDIDCDCREPGDPEEPGPPLDPEQFCGRWDGDGRCPEGYDCLCHTCQQKVPRTCMEADVYGCRRCVEPKLPTVEFVTKEEDETNGVNDYSEFLLDLDFDKRPPIEADCRGSYYMRPNSGGAAGCDQDGGDADCKSRLKRSDYSNFRAENPDVTEDNIFCDSDECYYNPPCPDGYRCSSTGTCVPVPFSYIPSLNGFVNLKVKVEPGSAPGSKFIVEDVVFRATRLRTKDRQLLPKTMQEGSGEDLGNGEWKIVWDTTNSFTGKTPNAIIQLEAFVYDSGGLQCREVITVRLAEFDNGHEDAITAAELELVRSGVSEAVAIGIIAEAVEQGQPWNRGIEPEEVETTANCENSQSDLSAAERNNNRAEIQQIRQSRNNLAPNYPCGEGPDIDSDECDGAPHARDGYANTISGGPYGNAEFGLGDSDYPCPDAKYYPEDKVSDFNTDGVRLSSLPADQRGEPRIIPAYQWYLELQSEPSDWKNGVANPDEAKKEWARGVIEGAARDKEIKDNLKNGEVSCVESPCPDGYICSEDFLCVEPEIPEPGQETDTDTNRGTSQTPSDESSSTYTDPTYDWNVGSIEVEITRYPGQFIKADQYRRVRRRRRAGDPMTQIITIRDNPGDTNNLSEFPGINIRTSTDGTRYVSIYEDSVISFRTYDPPQKDPFLSGNFDEYIWDVDSLSWIPR